MDEMSKIIDNPQGVGNEEDIINNIIFYEPDEEELITVESTLTKEDLDNATEIVYGFDNGSVPEPWHYECSVCVCRGGVRVAIKEGYYNNGEGFYSDESNILELEYEQFLIELKNLHKVRYYYSINNDGAPQHWLTVKNGKEVLFTANLDNLDISQKRLEDMFLALMSDSQKEIVSDRNKIEGLLDEYNGAFAEYMKNYMILDKEYVISNMDDEIVITNLLDNVDSELDYTKETDEDGKI